DKQFRILVEVSSDISERPGNICKELRIAFDLIDIDESPCGFEIALQTRKVEQPTEGFSICPNLALRFQPVEIVCNQFIDQAFVERNVGITQQGSQIVGRRSHQGILKINHT